MLSVWCWFIQCICQFCHSAHLLMMQHRGVRLANMTLEAHLSLMWALFYITWHCHIGYWLHHAAHNTYILLHDYFRIDPCIVPENSYLVEGRRPRDQIRVFRDNTKGQYENSHVIIYLLLWLGDILRAEIKWSFRAISCIVPVKAVLSL